MKQILLMTLGLSVALFANMSKTGNIVTDSETLLQWQDDTVGSRMDWSSAITYCEGLILDGHSDWRLPNIKELNSLVDESKVNPAIYSIFSNSVSTYYWSSTTSTGNSVNAWGVYFNNGSQDYDNKYNSRYVRCVRAGQ